MKTIYLFLSLSLLTNNIIGQWQQTQISNLSNELVYDIAEHNGNLFGAINSKGLVKYNGTAWDSVAVTGFTFNLNSIHIERLASNGTYLYAVVQNQLCASSMIYKSTDDGATFTLDTVGLPKYTCNNEVATVNYIYSLNDYIVITLNASTYRKKPTDASWVLNTDVSASLADLWAGYNSTWYTWYNYNLHTSVDKGVSWSTPANTGLPGLYLAKVLNVDKTTGRIYVAGRVITTSQPKMFYSDNEGATWDSVAINQYLTLNWIGQKQQVIGMASQGSFIEMDVVNNSNGSHPDVLASNDGGITFTVDTAGLPANSFGTVASRRMLFYNNGLFIAFSNGIFKKSVSTSIESLNSKTNYSIYPNPTKDAFFISNLNNDEKIQVSDIKGKLLLNQTKNSIDLSSFPNGMYFIQIISNTNSQTFKVIKQ